MSEHDIGNNGRRRKPLIAGFMIVLSCCLVAGLAGLFASLLMFWMTYQQFGVDPANKHGISHQNASRLGGLAILVCALTFYWISVYLDLFYIDLETIQTSNWIVLCSLSIGGIGLWGDMLGEISPQKRLILSAILFSICLLLVPEILPKTIGVSILDGVLSISPIAYFLSLIACIGLINAANMADGANGLMPLVFTGIFYSFYTQTLDPLYLSVAAAAFVFSLFNVFLGKLYLGDFGSYGLGALASLGALLLVAQGGVNIWFVLCIGAYPVIDFFVSIGRRRFAGKSPFSADDDHMHNRVYEFLRNFGLSPLAANSTTGVTISTCTTGITLMLMNIWNIDALAWLVLFLFFVVIYLVAYRLLLAK